MKAGNLLLLAGIDSDSILSIRQNHLRNIFKETQIYSRQPPHLI